MENIIIIAILAAIVGLAVWYVIRTKKRGAKCIGCPVSKDGGCCSCGCHNHAASKED